jgi:hypothetical protein
LGALLDRLVVQVDGSRVGRCWQARALAGLARLRMITQLPAPAAVVVGEADVLDAVLALQLGALIEDDDAVADHPAAERAG